MVFSGVFADFRFDFDVDFEFAFVLDVTDFFLAFSGVFADFSFDFDVDLEVAFEVDVAGSFLVAFVFAEFEVAFLVLGVVAVDAAVFLDFVFC